MKITLAQFFGQSVPIIAILTKPYMSYRGNFRSPAETDTLIEQYEAYIKQKVDFINRHSFSLVENCSHRQLQMMVNSDLTESLRYLVEERAAELGMVTKAAKRTLIAEVLMKIHRALSVFGQVNLHRSVGFYIDVGDDKEITLAELPKAEVADLKAWHSADEITPIERCNSPVSLPSGVFSEGWEVVYIAHTIWANRMYTPEEPFDLNEMGNPPSIAQIVEESNLESQALSVASQSVSKDNPGEVVMTKLNNMLSKNRDLATRAAVLETGRIANNQASKLLSKQLPVMVRGYADTPLGRLLIANAVVLGAQQFRPDDAKVTLVTEAMIEAAYQELIQSVDIEGFIEEFMNTSAIKKAVAQVERTEKAANKTVDED